MGKPGVQNQLKTILSETLQSPSVILILTYVFIMHSSNFSVLISPGQPLVRRKKMCDKKGGALEKQVIFEQNNLNSPLFTNKQDKVYNGPWDKLFIGS